jgi:hypothetical protein
VLTPSTPKQPKSIERLNGYRFLSYLNQYQQQTGSIANIGILLYSSRTAVSKAALFLEEAVIFARLGSKIV